MRWRRLVSCAVDRAGPPWLVAVAATPEQRSTATANRCTARRRPPRVKWGIPLESIVIPKAGEEAWSWLSREDVD
jgi:hypothetical protein